MPFFSIIVPTYNRAHTLGRCIDSIINQTCADWELIIVDDGSTDETEQLVKSYIDIRIKYVFQENQERSAARNHGIKLAKGEWVCFQDSDDEYLPEHLLILHDGIRLNTDYKVFRTGLKIYESGIFVRNSDQEIRNYDQFPFECLQTFAVHYLVFNKIHFNIKFSRGEDLVFLLEMGKIESIFHIKDRWTVNYNYDNSTSWGYGDKYRENLLGHIYSTEYLLSKSFGDIDQYLKRKRCIIEMIKLKEDMGRNQCKILSSVVGNLHVFLRFPIEYLKTFISVFK